MEGLRVAIHVDDVHESRRRGLALTNNDETIGDKRREGLVDGVRARGQGRHVGHELEVLFWVQTGLLGGSR